MAQMAHEAGTTTIVATPHMAARYPTAPSAVTEGVARLEPELAAAGIPLAVVPGGEIAVDFLEGMSDADLRAAALGGGGRWVLIEMPFRGWPLRLPDILRGLEMMGMGAVIAHPERAETVQRAPHRMHELVGLGALVQITAGSITGEHGALARRTSEAMLRDGTVHFIASDGHSAGWRAPVLGDAVDEAGRILGTPPEELSWMVDEGPRLVIQGRPIRPPRLAPSRKPRGDARPAPSVTRRSPRK